MSQPFRTFAAAAAFVMASACAVPASATVLSFDDLTIDGLVPANYGGLDWSAGGWTAFSGVQAPYSAHSGGYRIATDFGAADSASTIRFNAPVVFSGAWFSGFADAPVSFKLYLGSTLVASSATLAPSETPAFLASGFGGSIDSLVVASPNHAFFAMDDLAFTAAVPEPGTHALLLAGLGVLLVARRARRDL